MKFTNHDFFCFTKFISSFSAPISFNNLQSFLTQCWIFWQFKKCNTSFYSICITKGTLTSWNATIISKTTSIRRFLMTFLTWILIISFLSLIFINLPRPTRQNNLCLLYDYPWLYVNKLYFKEDYFQYFSISLFYHLYFVFHYVFTFYRGPPRFHD